MEITLQLLPVVNLALQQNHIPLVKQLTILNKSHQTLHNLTLELTSDPPFALPQQYHIDTLQEGQPLEVPLSLTMSTDYFANLTERVEGRITATLWSQETKLCETQAHTAVLAFDQWHGLSVMPQMVAAFVTPNQSEVAPIIRKASSILQKWSGDPSVDGYMSRDVARVRLQMAALFEAIAEQGISYSALPASYEPTGQRIRLCDSLMANRLGNCIELSLLYASCLEAMSLNPLLVFISGHCFVGCWLIPECFADSVSDDVSLLKKRMAEGINEVLLVEATMMCSGSQASFDDAVRKAQDNLLDESKFELFVDICRARAASIRPLPLRRSERGQYVMESPEEEAVGRQGASPGSFRSTDIIVDNPNQKVGKQELWERKLLDLSLRNNLLNTRITKGSIQLISVDVNTLEDALTDGQGFSILSRPTEWTPALSSAGIYPSPASDDPIVKLVQTEQMNQKLRSYLDEETLKKSLTRLYRGARLTMEESGSNTLYLAIGLLKWYESKSSKRPRFAPILLLPVEIVRSHVAGGYLMRSRGEEIMLNITLLEMLRQLFNINVTGLSPLPKDGSGVDVPLIFNIMRHAVMNQTGWDVVEQAIVGSFSFSKYIMWNDIHSNADKLAKNQIVESLITGMVKVDTGGDGEEEQNLDEQYADLLLPISADSSQMTAIADAVAGRNFVLHGPPGSGKSQTITNIIANALYRGKKVLFVAEKMAALQVVQKRLESIGLAPFCLELHSNKTRKTSVLEQLQRNTEVVRRMPSEEYALQAARLTELRRELSDYVRALHTPKKAGCSVYDCLAHYAAQPEALATVTVGQGLFGDMSREKMDRMDDMVAEYQTSATLCQPLGTHPLQGLGTDAYSPTLRDDGQMLLEQLSAALETLSNSDVAALFGLENEELSTGQLAQFADLIEALEESKHLNGNLLTCLTDSLVVALRQAVKDGQAYSRLQNEADKNYTANLCDIDTGSLRQRWAATSSLWLFPRMRARKAILAELQAYMKSGRLPRKEEVPAIAEFVDNLAAARHKIAQHTATAAPLFGSLWQNENTDWELMDKSITDTENFSRKIATFAQNTQKDNKIRNTLATQLGAGHERFMLSEKQQLDAYRQAATDSRNLLQRFAKLAQTATADTTTFSALRAAVARWREGWPRLHDWCVYNTSKRRLAAEGLGTLVDAVENGAIETEQISAVYKKSFYRAFAEHLIAGEPRLASFHKVMFEEKIRRFNALTETLQQLTRDEIVAHLSSQLPPLPQDAAQTSEVGILLRNIRNGGRGTSIRRLFDQIHDRLYRMCPCMLMSPISVAQYIDPAHCPFDLVIFDEASQMPTCEAVGAIARGKSLVVVGDPKQMPPTSFFAANTYDEDNADIEDLESILDDCLALSIPSRYLKWHYRSRHESLIAFSNVHYYENQLLTFPSPDDLTSKTTFQHIEGTYDKGHSRQNPEEARAIVDEIKRRLVTDAKHSIGVVTFNSNQQSLIEDLLTEMLDANPDLEEKALGGDEPIFVKNLENVQGDERDIILFSVGFGPDKQGRISLNFGPLNREGGWRRLNVAVSRARYEMKVFSTLRGADIDLNRTAAAGVAGLKAFLDYAESGGKEALNLPSLKPSSESSFSKPQTGRLRTTSNDLFVDALAKALRERGYEVKTHVGRSGYRVDIGVVDPVNPGRYRLGILCDGYNYCGAKTTRDRETGQPSVLRALGWRLCRAWSVDWWERRDQMLDELCATIENGEQQDETAAKETVDCRMNGIAELQSNQASQNGVPEVASETASTPQDTASTSPYSIPYTYTPLPDTPISGDLFVSPQNEPEIKRRLALILHNEAPIGKPLLMSRLIASFGISRRGPRINATVEHLLNQMHVTSTGSGEETFYWNDETLPNNYRLYRPLSDRDALMIAPSEMLNAIRWLLFSQGALPKDELVRLVAREFGFSRAGNNVAAAVERALALGFSSHTIIESQGKVRQNL